MKRISETFSSWMNAITFAEAGEFDTARQMMPISHPRENRLSQLDKVFMSVTFAEAGLHEEALNILNVKLTENHQSVDFLEAIGLKGMNLKYAVLPIEAIS